jgi:DedD protein
VADLTHDTADDGFHEIQLSGKQLVFLFMATTVISVVIFLCGVLVGRGVNAEGIDQEPGLAASAEPEPAPATLTSEPIATDPPATPAGGLGYTDRLEGGKTQEKLKAPEEDSAPVREIPTPAVEPPPAPEPKASPAREPEKTPAPAPAETGARPGTWAVQVISLSDRRAATQIVQRLSGKGYPAFLVSPVPGAPMQVYKVQVGRYRDRAEAQKVDARLKKEEKFETWIVR